ncbi:MAG: thiol-disulfide oxidoreductase DCC family protein [Flavobacteriales bacterium]
MSRPDSIIFFDGVCNFCNSTVNWLMIRNKRGNLKFASLQGESAKVLLPEEWLNDLSSIVFYRRGKCYVKSTAVLFIFIDLAWYGVLVLPFFLVPTFIRNYLYDGIARNRYRWFGKRSSCRIPTTEEQSRFLK